LALPRDDFFNAAQATVTIPAGLSVVSLQAPASNACNFTYISTETPTAANPSFAGAIVGGGSTYCVVYTMTVQGNTVGSKTIALSNGSIKSQSDSSEMLASMTNGTYTINATAATNTPTFTLTPVPPTATVTSIPRSSSTPTITPTSQFTPTPSAACIALSRKLADTNNDGVINNIKRNRINAEFFDI
jgi:hypothetical protein